MNKKIMIILSIFFLVVVEMVFLKVVQHPLWWFPLSILYVAIFTYLLNIFLIRKEDKRLKCSSK